MFDLQHGPCSRQTGEVEDGNFPSIASRVPKRCQVHFREQQVTERIGLTGPEQPYVQCLTKPPSYILCQKSVKLHADTAQSSQLLYEPFVTKTCDKHAPSGFGWASADLRPGL
jgi:hypothetical protein